MNSNLTPEERSRIVEEQRLRDSETTKNNLKTFGKMWLVIGGVVLTVGCCMCLCVIIFLTTTYGSLISNY